MDQTFFASGTIDRRAFAELSRRSDARGLAQLLLHVAALLLTGACVASARGTAWLWPAMAVHGVVLVFLFAPLHESIHRTAFRSPALNDALARVCGLLLFLPCDSFRAFHFAHHRHTQDPERDPELARPKPRSLGAVLWHVSGLPHWSERIGTLARHGLGLVREGWIESGARAGIVHEARVAGLAWGAVFLASLLAGDSSVLVLWVVPLLLGQPFLRLYLLAEHTGCPTVSNMLQNSRTTETTAALRWLAWNMPFHAEHHACPAIPFHALPRAHELLGDHLGVRARGYVEFTRDLWTQRPGL